MCFKFIEISCWWTILSVNKNIFWLFIIIFTYRASMSALLTLKSCLMINVKDSWRNTGIPPLLPFLLTWWVLLYCGNLKRLWFIELPDHQVSVIHITLNSNLSDINRLKRLSRFFWKLLIFRCSIEKLLLSKCFKFREDSLEVKYCKHLKLKAF